MNKRSLYAIIAALVGVIGVSLAAESATAQSVPALRAGAASVDVTPRIFPIKVRGRIRESARDSLNSRALVFDDGETQLAMVVVDNLGVAEETAADAKARAAERCGIPPEKVMVASTHTHTAPSSNVKEGAEALVDYRKVLVEGIATSIVEAHDALRPAAVGRAVHPLPDEVWNRRWFLKPGKMPPNPWGDLDKVKMNPGRGPELLDRPAGPVDPDLTVLAVRDVKNRKPLSMFANYTLHYVGGIPGDQVSADYFGEFSRLMPFRVRGDDDFVAMMSNGASGDINNIPFTVTRPPREPFEQMRIVARKAADAAWFAWKDIEDYRSDVNIGMIERKITLKLREPTQRQIERAEATLSAAEDEKEREQLPKKAVAYAHKTRRMKGGGQITVPLQAIHIGDFALCAIPFETLVEIGLELKERSPFPRTVVVGIANGYNGYLPTPEQHELGGYETWLGTCRVQEDASVLIVDQLLNMLGDLRNNQ